MAELLCPDQLAGPELKPPPGRSGSHLLEATETGASQLRAGQGSPTSGDKCLADMGQRVSGRP